MSIREMRIGDTIIGNDGRQYVIEVKSFDRVKAREIDLPRRLKTFTDKDDIFCVDFDDGLWQQTQ